MVTISGFLGMLLAAEVMARLLLPSLPADPHTWPRAEIGQKLEQIEALEKRDAEADVVFAGSSLTAAAINPQLFTEETGITSYNAAFAGPSMKTVTRWVLDVVVPKLSPEMVVIGVASRDVNDNGPKNQRVYDSFVESPGYRQETASFASEIEGWLEDVSVFMRYRRLFREPASLFDDSSTTVKDQNIRKEIGPGGIRVEEPRNYATLPKLARQMRKGTLVNYETGGVEFEALLEMKRGLEDRGIEMMVVSMPVTPDYVAAHEHPKADMATYNAFIDDFAAQTGVTVVDAQEAFATPLPFRDLMHLDVEGRDAVTRALVASWDEIGSGGRLEMSCSDDPAPTCELHEATRQ